MIDDLTRLRARATEGEDDATRPPVPPVAGASRFAAITVAVSSYPTTAAAFYGFKRRDIAGPEIEGGAGTEATTGGVGYAFNLGDAVPPVGTVIEITAVSFRNVFTFGVPRTT